jgi:AcrR family transcriptional regulator
MAEVDKLDGRREAGRRTRRRLLEASRALLAEHGRSGVTLRTVTESAEANVAAVRYHFGSMEALLDVTIEHAVEALAEAQAEGLRRLPRDAGVSEIVAAWARPVLGAVSGPPSEDRTLIRAAARASTDPSPDVRERIRAAATRAEPALLAALRRALPPMSDDALRLRVECATGVLHYMAAGVMRVELDRLTGAEAERLLVPVLTATICAPPGS